MVYESRLQSKECVICKEKFLGKRQERNCANCKGVKNLDWEVKDRPVICPDCGITLRVEKVKVGRKAKLRQNKKSIRRCRPCQNKAISASKKGDKNPNWNGGPKPKRSREEVLEFLSNRMRENNPMKIPETREKVGATIRRKIAVGEIVYKLGKENHLWVGNRERSFTIRSRLYKKWALPIRRKSKGICENCHTYVGKMEVHHTEERFSDIIRKFSPIPLCDLTHEDFEEVSKKVVDYHVVNKVPGAALCIPCHKNIDPQRR